MKLRDFVRDVEIEDGKFLHIGAICGFFFVGTKQEFFETINDVDSDCRKVIEEKMARAKQELRARPSYIFPEVNIDELPKTSIKDVERFCETLIKLSREADKKIQSRIYRARKNYRTYHDCVEILDKWVHLRDREVKESYERTSEDGIIIIVEGQEHGSAWDRQEFLYGSSECDEE